MAKTKKPAKKSVKKPAKRSGKKTNGAVKNPAPVASFLAQPQAAPQPPSYRELKTELGAEVTEFRDYLVAKYSDYHGHDMRKDVAWYLEQYGNGILSDIERAKRIEREKIIAENRAKEEAERAAQEVAPK